MFFCCKATAATAIDTCCHTLSLHTALPIYLLTSNCHEFNYYDDLLRESDTQNQAQRKRSARQGKAKPKPDSAEARKQEAFDLVTEVIEDIAKERGEEIGRAHG